MNETTMPAAEAEGVVLDAPEHHSYELAFHVLPTVAEGEVPAVFAAIKDIVTKAGAEIFDEEAPERFELAYEIVKHLEGKNRAFSSAYFGWVRFKGEAGAAVAIAEAVGGRSDILRHLMIRLTRVEEAHAFRFHEALASLKMVTNVEETDIVPDADEVASGDDSEDNSEESSTEGVDADAIDEALKKDEA